MNTSSNTIALYCTVIATSFYIGTKIWESSKKSDHIEINASQSNILNSEGSVIDSSMSLIRNPLNYENPNIESEIKFEKCQNWEEVIEVFKRGGHLSIGFLKDLYENYYSEFTEFVVGEQLTFDLDSKSTKSLLSFLVERDRDLAVNFVNSRRMGNQRNVAMKELLRAWIKENPLEAKKYVIDLDSRVERDDMMMFFYKVLIEQDEGFARTSLGDSEQEQVAFNLAFGKMLAKDSPLEAIEFSYKVAGDIGENVKLHAISSWMKNDIVGAQNFIESNPEFLVFLNQSFRIIARNDPEGAVKRMSSYPDSGENVRYYDYARFHGVSEILDYSQEDGLDYLYSMESVRAKDVVIGNVLRNNKVQDLEDKFLLAATLSSNSRITLTKKYFFEMLHSGRKFDLEQVLRVSGLTEGEKRMLQLTIESQ